MRFAVEQQVKSGLGVLHWLRVAGSFETRPEAERVATRLSKRDAPVRVVDDAREMLP
jgi:hypothetical protein